MRATCLDCSSGQKINSSVEVSSYISFADDKLGVSPCGCFMYDLFFAN